MALQQVLKLGKPAWLADARTQRVLAMLTDAGEQAYVVGGAVRNALMSLPIDDIDIATSAEPMRVIELAERADLKTIKTGFEHGTVTVIAGQLSFEVTTFRADVETDGRHAKVQFSRDVAHDAHRRDFTMNALYCDAEGLVLDPVGGLPDVLARRVTFIGDARTRIREDYLRTLRYFRFAARYGAAPLLDADLDAIVAEREGLRQLSAERVQAEIFKILGGRNAGFALQAMAGRGVLVGVFGSVLRLPTLERLIALEHALASAPDTPLRLAVLTLSCREDALRLNARLKLSNTHAGVLDDVGRALDARLGEAMRAWSPKTARAHAYRRGQIGFQRDVKLAWALSGDTPDTRHWRDISNAQGSDVPQCFPLGGADAMALGFKPGPAMGQALRDLETWWIEQDFRPDAQALRTRLIALKQATATGHNPASRD